MYKMKKFFITINIISLTIVLFFNHADAQIVGQEFLPDGAKERFGKGWIRDVEFSPDGKKFAVATTIGVWIYDSLSGNEENLLEDSLISGTEALAYAPSGSILAVAHEDFTIRLWNPTIIDQERPIPALRGHTGRIHAIIYSPDGSMIASASDDKTIRLWNPNGQNDREKLIAILPYKAPVSCVDISSDNHLIAGGSDDGIVQVWDAGTGEPVREPNQAHKDAVVAVHFSPDRTELASASPDGSFKIWNLVGNETTLSTTEQWNLRLYALEFSPDGNTVATGTSDKQIKLWDKLSAAETNPLKGHRDIVTTIDYSPDGRALVSGSPDGKILFWDIIGKRIRYEIAGHTGGVKTLAYSEDNRIRACGAGLDGKLRIWDAGTSTALSLLRDHIGLIQAVTFSKNSKTLASGGKQDGTVFISDVNNILENSDGFDDESLLTILTGNEHGITALAIAPEDSTLATGGVDGRIHLIDLNSKRKLDILRGPQSTITALTFLKDGTRLFSGEENGTVRHWNGLTGREIGTGFNISFGAVTALTYSPINEYLAVGDVKGKIQFYNPKTGSKNTKTFQTPHRSKITSLVFSNDGNSMVSGSENGTIILWNMKPVYNSPEKQTKVPTDRNLQKQNLFGNDNEKPELTAQEIAKIARASTVYLTTLNANSDVIGYGSGFFIAPGYIATNFHVIDGSSTIYARVVDKEKWMRVHTVLASDKLHDLAILKVSESDIPILNIVNSDEVEIGEKIYAVGNPKGFLEGTVSDGIISGIRGQGKYKIIQMTAPISPGSSGGPVLNTRAEVIGITAGDYSSQDPKYKINRTQNLNVAIPSNYLKDLLRSIK